MLKFLSYPRILLTLTLTLFSTIYAHAEPNNLDLLKQNLQAYHDSGAYNHDIAKIAQRANIYIHQRVVQNKHAPHPKHLAIVLDIDETSLSNYHNMSARQFTATKAQLVKEIHAANLPAVKPILNIYKNALKQGVAVFFVTGRHHSERSATIINLKNAGFKEWSGLYFKPNQYNHRSVVTYKARAREIIARQGYTIIASIGDQCSDFKGGYTEAAFKLPNPYYYLP
jgi:predicted secreted acid phosphatase